MKFSKDGIKVLKQTFNIANNCSESWENQTSWPYILFHQLKEDISLQDLLFLKVWMQKTQTVVEVLVLETDKCFQMFVFHWLNTIKL